MITCQDAIRRESFFHVFFFLILPRRAFIRQLVCGALQPPRQPMSLFANAFLPPGDSAARCVEFLTAKTACDWTVEWSCPGSSNPGRSGLAGDDGSLAFFCCCKVVFPAELQHQRLAQEWNALVTHEHPVEGDYRGQE